MDSQLTKSESDRPATLNEVLSLIEASNVAQGIAISAALQTIDPRYVDRFATNLAELAPLVGAGDDVAQRFLELVHEGVCAFRSNT